MKLHCMMAAFLTALTALAPTAPLLAAPDPPPLVGAGPQPTEDQARQAVIDELKRGLTDPRDFKRVRFVSGPHLVTGLSFADNREEAWQMCVIQGDNDISKGSPDVEVRPWFLRSSQGALRVVSNVNWKTYDNHCW